MEPSAHSPAQHVYRLLQQVVGSLVGHCYPCLVRLSLHGKPHNKHKASISTTSHINHKTEPNTATKQMDTTLNIISKEVWNKCSHVENAFVNVMNYEVQSVTECDYGL